MNCNFVSACQRTRARDCLVGVITDNKIFARKIIFTFLVSPRNANGTLGRRGGAGGDPGGRLRCKVTV